MVDPCQFQNNIIEHGENIAKQGQAIDTMTETLKIISKDVSTIAEKLSNMRGFVAGASAAGGAMVALMVYLAAKVPALFGALLK